MNKPDLVALCIIGTIALPLIGASIREHNAPRWKRITRTVLISCFLVGLVLTAVVAEVYPT